MTGARMAIVAGAVMLLQTAACAQYPTPPLAADERVPPAIVLDGNSLRVPGQIMFKDNDVEPGADAAIPLAAVKTYLETRPFISTLRIEGHVEGVPDAQSLSEARALAVARDLVRLGADCKRLIVTGFGDTKPVVAPPSAANTRIEFVNAALRERAIGGLPLDGGGRVAGDACQ